MIGTNEKCLDPWIGFLIILGVCAVILAAIFHEFRSGTHHARIHAKPGAMVQAGFINSNVDTQSGAQQIIF